MTVSGEFQGCGSNANLAVAPGSICQHPRDMMTSAIPAFSDGWLTAIDLGDPGAEWGQQTIVLKLRRHDQARFKLILAGVEALYVADLPGNFEVSEVTVVYAGNRKLAELDFEQVGEALRRLFPAPHASAAQQHHDDHVALLASQVGKLEEASAALVWITGNAELIAFCRDVKLRACDE